MVNSGRKETRPIESGGKVKKARERTCLLLCGNMSPSFQTLIIPLVSVNHPQMEHECEEIQGPRVNKCAVFLPPHHTHNRHHEQPHGTEDTTRSHIGHTTRNTTAQNAQQNRQPTSKHATHSTTTRNTTQTQPCDTRTNGTKHTPHTKHNTHAGGFTPRGPWRRQGHAEYTGRRQRSPRHGGLGDHHALRAGRG